PSNYVFDGVSIKDFIYGNKKDTDRKWVLAMGGNAGGSRAKLSEKGLENNFKYRDRVIRDKQYKLFISSEKKPVKLIDVCSDFEEKNDLLPSLSTNRSARKAFKKLWKVAQEQPDQDNDPKYIPTPPMPWDYEVTVKSQE